MVPVQSEVICYVIAVAFITCPSVTTGQNAGGSKGVKTCLIDQVLRARDPVT